LAEQASAGDIIPIADPHSLFAELAAAGVSIMVATTDNRKSTLHTLKQLEVLDFVIDVLCGDDNRPLKPSPDAVHHLASHAGFDTEDIVFVGDTIADLRMAANAGAKAIGVASGTASAVELAPWAISVMRSIADIVVSARS
jgi:phosphoglycolate phosphatase